MSEEVEESGGGGGWLVSYADLMTLLFAAFVVLYGITPEGVSRSMKGIESTIREAFIEVPDDLKDYELTPGPIKLGRYKFKAASGEPEISTDKVTIKQSTKVAIEMDKNRVDNLLDEISTSNGKQDYKLRNSMTTEPFNFGFKIKLMGSYFYDGKSTRLQAESRKRVITLGNYLKKTKRRIRIEGHTDSLPAPEGLTNTTIGALRAAHAANLLIKESLINEQIIDTVSFGADKPIDSNDSPKTRQRNRRIEIKVIYE